jgi:RNA polymerase sigma factor (TIGR02999 family)
MDKEHAEESVTEVLQRWTSGDNDAFEQLIELVYDDLRRISARHFRRESSAHTLQATAILHEALLRLMKLEGVEWTDRGHFYAVAAKMLRQLLVDHARERRREKRGGGQEELTLSEAEGLVRGGRAPDIEALEDALQVLEARDPQKVRIVELRFFVGLTGEEISRCLGISTATVAREWQRARLWLYSEIQGEKIDG